MKRLCTIAIATAALGCMACIEAPPVTPGGAGTSVLVRPGQSAPPVAADPAMPASLPPPPLAMSLVQTNGLYRTGSTFFVVGGAFLGAGVVFAVLGAVLPCKLGDSGCSTTADVQSQKTLGDTFLAAGIGAIIGGVIFMGVGIPLAVLGANQVKRQMGYAFFAGPEGAGIRF